MWAGTITDMRLCLVLKTEGAGFTAQPKKDSYQCHAETEHNAGKTNHATQ
jgi:hypothetical protein